MERTLEWLLNLDRIDLRETAELTLQWQEPLDSWLWFVLLVLVPTYVILIYRYDGGTRRMRTLMASLRAFLILLTILLLTKPAIVLRRDRSEPSTVAVMLDQSASMERRDYYADTEWQSLSALAPADARQATLTRWEIAQAALTHADAAALNRLLEKHELRFFKFGGAATAGQIIADPGRLQDVLNTLAREQPAAATTDIARSLAQVFESCIDAHLAGIVLLTDGQPTQQTEWDKVLQHAQARAVPIFVVPLGSPVPPKDLAVQNLRFDRFVYIADQASVRCDILASEVPPGQPFEVLLSDPVEARTLASQQVVARPGVTRYPVELKFKPQAVGPLALTLEVRPLEDELDRSNNARQVRMTVVEEHIKVLYVDGYPRYEYRYLKNALLREPSITSSTLLLSADESFVQEGDEPIRRFPATADELQEYDVLLIGDIDPAAGWISPAQMELVTEFVSRKGGGFGLIAGQWFTPRRLAGTPWSSLIPVQLQAAGGAAESASQPFRPRLTAAGRESPMWRLLLDRAPELDTLERLPQWYWHYAAGQPRPGAEVLLERPDAGPDGAAAPLVVEGRYGAGRVLYHGSDDTWRWRRYRGQDLYDAYWVQVARYLARNKKFDMPQGIALRTDRRKLDRTSPVVLTLEFEDAGQSSAVPDVVQVAIRSGDGVELARAALTRLTADSKRFQGIYQPETTGQLEARFEPDAYDLEGAPAVTLFEVERQTLENRRPQANVGLMSQLARRTGAQIVQPWNVADLQRLIPDQAYVIPDDVTESIWDSKLAMGLFVLLITAEWVLRKLSGLP